MSYPVHLSTTGTFFGGEYAAKIIPVIFRYEPANPLAILIEFPADSAGPGHTWEISRDLLSEGMGEPLGVGEGDVRIWLTPERVYIELSSPDGVACLRFHASEIRGFLTQTVASVTPGTEYDSYLGDLFDAELSLFFS